MKIDIKSVSNFDELTKYRGIIAYGIPQETAKIRKDEHDNKNIGVKTYNNAEILRLMENGSFLNNIPERPLLRPVLEKHKDQIFISLNRVNHFILNKQIAAADMEMEKLAFKVETWTKAYFTDPDNNWAPNAYITVHGGWMRNKKTGKPIYIEGKHSNRPLIDTGSLRQAIRGVFYRNGKD